MKPAVDTSQPQPAAQSAKYDKPYRVGSEIYHQRHGHRYPHRAPAYLGRASRREHRSNYQRHHTRTYALEYGAHHLILLYDVGSKEYGDSQNYQKRRQDSAQSGHHTPFQPAQTVADAYRNVYRKNARKRLRHSQQVEKLLAAYPVVLVDYLTLDYGYHGPSAAKGECTDFQKRPKKRPVYPSAGRRILLHLRFIVLYAHKLYLRGCKITNLHLFFTSLIHVLFIKTRIFAFKFPIIHQT